MALTGVGASMALAVGQPHPSQMRFYSIRKQLRNPHTQRLRQIGYHGQCRVPLPPLDPTDVGPVLARPVPKLLLAPAPLQAELAEPLAEFPVDWFHAETSVGACSRSC